MVTQLKINNGWSDIFTPPQGQVIDNVTGLPVPVHQNCIVNQVNFGGVSLPPPPPDTICPPNTPNVPDAIHVPLGLVGSLFGRHAAEESKEDNSIANISKVTINGQSFYTGPVFDASEQRLE